MKNTCSGLPYENDTSTWLDSFLLSFLEEPTCSTYGWGPVQTYPAYTEIIRQDTLSHAVYFLKSGEVKLTWADQEGHEVIAGLRHQNWLIGAPSVLLGKPYSFTIATLTQCALRCISAEKFLHLVHSARTLVTLGCVPAKERLKHMLFRFLPDMPSKKRAVRQAKITLPLKYKELAQILAVTPEHLSRLLKEMETRHEIQRKKDGSIILNLDSFQ